MISAVNSAVTGDQLNPFDTINGQGGVDTLQVVLVAAWGGGATITGVEQIFTQGAFNFSTTGIAGLTDVKTITALGSFTGLTNATVTAHRVVKSPRIRAFKKQYFLLFRVELTTGS